MEKVKKYLINVLVAFDQGVNAIIGGDPDMTLSGRMGRAVAANRCKLCRLICWALDKVDKDHCARANKFESDEGAHEAWKL
jgi:hypothetical protein